MIEVPRKARFQRAEQRADEFLVQQQIDRLPFDPQAALRNLGVRLYTYEEMIARYGYTREEVCESFDSDDGYCSYDADKNKYVVAYNEAIFPVERQRWTLAHELGHIVLDHFTDFSQTRLTRGGLTDKEYKVLDQEADAFASEVLAPKLILFETSTSASDIHDVCAISKAAAKNKAKFLSSIRRFYLSTVAKAIRKQFYGFVHSYYCPDCNAVFPGNRNAYCPICGNKHATWYNPHLRIFSLLNNSEGAITHMHYPHYDMHQCPICENEEISTDDAYCKICGTPLVNTCTNEQCQADADNNARYCVRCGAPTTFFQSGALKSWREERFGRVPDEEIPF